MMEHRRRGPPFDATPLLRAVARRRLARLRALDPMEAQRALLLRLVRRAADTRFGRAHGFARVDSVTSYQARVPLRRYERFWDEWWRDTAPVLVDATWPGRVPYLALSSGTASGTTKYIPVTRAMVRANRGAALDTLAWHLDAHPDSRVFGGLSFMLGGSTALERVAPGVRQGDLSGHRVCRGAALPPMPGAGRRLVLRWRPIGTASSRRWRRRRRRARSAC